MSRIIKNIEVGIDEDLEERLQWLAPSWSDYRILRKSVDARKRHDLRFVYTLEVAENGQKIAKPQIKLEPHNIRTKIPPPIIIGSGPAGLFAALRFVERGLPCLLFERGSKAEKRITGINRFWRYGELDLRNNVCYGEGGAGLYSDGKLITRIKSPHIPYVLNRLVQFGAPSEIEYLSNPHVGSDKIRRVIPKLREFLQKNSCQIFYDTKVDELLFDSNSVIGVQTEYGQKFYSDHIILATGHSAEDMLHHLHERGVHLDGKSFAVGLRVEHPQNIINQIQYRQYAEHPKLGSANYKLAHHNKQSNIGVYSFCMCPGGYVLSSGTEPNGVVCNGMSNFNRNSPFANAALVVSIDHEKTFSSDIMGGLKFRKELEKNAFLSVKKTGGSKELPAQKLVDFISSKLSEVPKGSSPSGAVPVRLDELLPVSLKNSLLEGILDFDKSMKGFMSEKAVLYGVETRTSCPIRVTRDTETLESISHRGLYPCGEGAGYAGGITSAACDGIKIVEKIIQSLESKHN